MKKDIPAKIGGDPGSNRLFWEAMPVKTILSLQQTRGKVIVVFLSGVLFFVTTSTARPAHRGAGSPANPRATSVGDARSTSPGHVAAAAPLVSGWTTVQDPAEQAFSIEVPQGWKITGGLYRFGLLDPRLMVDMVSPDGKIDIRFGDYRVPPFAPLTPTLASLGFSSDGFGSGQSPISPYKFSFESNR